VTSSATLNGSSVLSASKTSTMPTIWAINETVSARSPSGAAAAAQPFVVVDDRALSAAPAAYASGLVTARASVTNPCYVGLLEQTRQLVSRGLSMVTARQCHLVVSGRHPQKRRQRRHKKRRQHERRAAAKETATYQLSCAQAGEAWRQSKSGPSLCVCNQIKVECNVAHKVCRKVPKRHRTVKPSIAKSVLERNAVNNRVVTAKRQTLERESAKAHGLHDRRRLGGFVVHRIRDISGSDDGRSRNTRLFGSERYAEVWRTSELALQRERTLRAPDLSVEHFTDLSSKCFRGEWFA
jgi:hypothetical protein